MSETPTTSTARPVPVLYVSEDDLARVLAGETVELPYPHEGISTVTWAADPFKELTPDVVEALRGDGDKCRVYAPGADEPFTPLMRIDAPTVAKDGRVNVELSTKAYRTLCGLVQTPERVEHGELDGIVAEELRRCFPAARYVREPAEGVRIDGISALSPKHATATARSMIEGWLGGAHDWDGVFLTPVVQENGRYSVTVICHHGHGV